jgi:hypothetical protein
VEDALRRKPAVTNVPFAPYEYARVLVIVCCPMDLSADEALEFSEWFGDCLQLQSAGSLAFLRHRRDDSSVVCGSVQGGGIGWRSIVGSGGSFSEPALGCWITQAACQIWVKNRERRQS